MGFGEMGVLLISETIISTQTAVAAPPDPISEWNNTGHRGNLFGMTTRGLGELCKMSEVKLTDSIQ